MLRIDAPANCIIDKPAYVIRGWYATEPRMGAGLNEIQIGGIAVSWSRVPRPDVCEHYPGMLVIGFSILLDVSYYMHAAQNGRLMITIVPKGEAAIPVEFTMHKDVVVRCLAAVSG